MVEERATNTIRNVTNGIILQVLDLPKNNKNQSRASASSRNKTSDGKNERKSSYILMFVTEFIATGLLLYLGCMACVVMPGEIPVARHMVSLAFGLIVLMIVQAFGHISGAHLNPAITISAFMRNILSPVMSVIYILGQFSGAIAGYALLKISAPPDYAKDGFCVTKPGPSVSIWQALLVEIMITGSLAITACAVWDKKNEMNQDSTPLRFALVVTGLGMVAGPLSGASMNTARTFGPGVIDGIYDDQWIYWVGPNLGAVLACLLYKFAFDEPDEEHSMEETASFEEVNDVKDKI